MKTPKLLTKDETADMLKDAEWLLKDLLRNNLGGYSDGNRPFYILHEFKRVIEKYGNRDVGLTWTYDQLKALNLVDDVQHNHSHTGD